MNNLDLYVIPKYGTYRKLSAEIKIHHVKMSLIKAGQVLPTVPVMRRMCLALGAMPTDLFPRRELDLIHCMGRTAEKRRNKKKTFRLPEGLPDDFLVVLGDGSWQAWATRHLERDLKRYKKKRPAGGANANGAGCGTLGNVSTSIIHRTKEDVKCAN